MAATIAFLSILAVCEAAAGITTIPTEPLVRIGHETSLFRPCSVFFPAYPNPIGCKDAAEARHPGALTEPIRALP